MAEHPRWAGDALSPRVTHSPDGYDYKAKGPVRRAALHDESGLLLGHVWTDDGKAAGYLPDEAAGPAGRRAGTEVWVIHRDAYKRKVAASDVLDPALYADVGKLGKPSTEPDA